MLDADDLRFFAAVARARSLASAARELNVSPPAVTQRLRGLEDGLGMRLVDRSGRHLTLTDEGELLARHGRGILGSFEALTDALAERRSRVTGNLRVLAPLGFGRRHIAAVVSSFRAQHPEVRVDLTLSDRTGRLSPEAWDLTIHVGDLGEVTPSLRVSHLAPNRRLLCAAPAYVARMGQPSTPDDLALHTCIALRENDEDVTLWRFRSPDGAERRIRVVAELASNDGEVVKHWAVDGLGLVVRSEWDVAEDVRAGRLVSLMEDYALPEAPVLALLGSGRRSRAARTVRFLKTLQEALTPPPWRIVVT